MSNYRCIETSFSRTIVIILLQVLIGIGIVIYIKAGASTRFIGIIIIVIISIVVLLLLTIYIRNCCKNREERVQEQIRYHSNQDDGILDYHNDIPPRSTHRNLPSWDSLERLRLANEILDNIPEGVSHDSAYAAHIARFLERNRNERNSNDYWEALTSNDTTHEYGAFEVRVDLSAGDVNNDLELPSYEEATSPHPDTGGWSALPTYHEAILYENPQYNSNY